MILVLKIITGFLYMAWPMVLFTSFMMFDAPGSENDERHIINVVAVLCYPIYISLLYLIFGGSWLGLNGIILFLISVVIVFIGLEIFGYNSMIYKIFVS